MKKILHWTLIACLLTAGLLLIGCVEEKGPMEKAGEKIDDAIEDTGDKLEDIGDEIEDAADDVQDSIDGEG